MKDKTNLYEYHGLDIKKLPFIFHYDKVDSLTAPANWHKNIEILCFEKGSGTVECGTQKFKVEKGNIVIFNTNTLHRITSDSQVEYFCLIADSEFCEKNDINTDSVMFESKIEDQKAYDLYKTVAEAFQDTGLYRNASIKAAVLNLIIYLAKNYGTICAKKYESAPAYESIQVITGYILANISQKFTIEDLCSQAGMSKYYFIRMFKKYTGYSPVTYINRSRCEIAKRLLDSKEYSVTEISEKTGFDSSAYFCKIFKKYNGISPKSYASGMSVVQTQK